MSWPGVIKGINYEDQVAGHENDLSYVAAALAPVIDMVTAISDVPIAALYEKLEFIYANRALILVYRNPFDWVRSVRNHIGDRNFNVFEKVQYWRYFAGEPTSLQHERIRSYIPLILPTIDMSSHFLRSAAIASFWICRIPRPASRSAAFWGFLQLRFGAS